MVELNGGAKTFILSAFFRSLLRNFIANKELFDIAPGPDEAYMATLELS